MDRDSPQDPNSPEVSDIESGDDETGVKLESSPISASSISDKKSSGKSAAHLKRRRVTRACDECRRKKIKCDGKQPCTHCTVYSYECTYDQPSNRRRNPAPQYVENLEHRAHRAEALLHILIPNLDLSDPGIDAAVAQGWIPGAPGKGDPSSAQEKVPPARQQTQQKQSQKQQAQQQSSSENKSDTLESMIRAVAQIEMDEAGNWDYHGHSSGLSFVRRMREQLGDLMGPETTSTPFLKSRPMSNVLDSPKSTVDSPLTGDAPTPSPSDLPPKHMAREICRCALEDAAALLRAIHGPTFWHHFDRLYSIPPEQYTNEDHKFLPLFHSAMALGHLFTKDEVTGGSHDNYESAIQQGFVHFKLTRLLMDIADSRDLMAIQAVILMILFLQSSAKLSQCYTYVGVALRSALRMGLHRKYKGNFDPLELEMRKRVFWVVRKLDIYVGALLGLPQMLSDDDIDQEYPAEVDDEYVTREGIRPMPEGRVSLLTAFNAHTRLVTILSKTIRCVYPIKVQEKELGSADQSYSVPFSTIRDIENDLDQWKNDLPTVLSPSPAPDRYTRVQHLLRLSYAQVQVMLYRPFLHYVARSGPIDQRAYACAASYVSVSRNVIHLASQMKQKGLLNGAFWFVMYTSFFAVLSLVYFAAGNPDNPTTQVIMKDAIEGKDVLASLATRSMAADRCTATLDVIFNRLPEWMRNGQQNPVVSRKRQHDAGRRTPAVQNPAASRSQPDVSVPERTAPNLQRRAGTFPRLGNAKPGVPLVKTMDAWPQSRNSSMGPQTPNAAADFSSAGSSAGPDSGVNFVNFPGSLNMSGGGMNPVQSATPYSMPQAADYYNAAAITDLSSIVFPTSEEPFGYPSQPLTTFETTQQQFIKPDPYADSAASSSPYSGITAQDQQHGGSVLAPMSNAVTGVGDDSIEAQFFALPPYLGQPQSFGANGFDMNSPQVPVTSGWPQAQQQHQQHPLSSTDVQMSSGDPMTGLNVQDIFGGTEWNSLLMNGFQVQ